MQYLDGAPAGGPVPLVLGDIVFEAFEIPAKMTFGTRQKLVVQNFPGGGKEVQAMGADPAPLSWSGRFRGASAAEDAAAVGRMAREGTAVDLSWAIFLYRVVIRDFTADFEAPYEVPYKISCDVVQDLTQEDSEEASTPASSFMDDIDDLSDAAVALSTSPALCSGLGAVTVAAGALVDSGILRVAGDALTAAAVVTPGTRAALAGALTAIAGAQALCAGVVGATSALPTGATLAAGVDPALAAAGLSGAANQLALAAATQQASWRLATMAATLGTY